ncbi:MAG TPA: SigE family RNA polymerase sigma factor [Acidimicrobiales bacterium]|jgi:RNA polymerase sigma-70 factor (sigma-E family)
MELLKGASARREFESFVADVTPGLMRTGHLLTWNLAESEDLVQETLLRVAKRWLSVKKMDYPGAYARRILVNLVLRGAAQRTRGDVELNSIDAPPADERFEREMHAIDTRSEILWMLSSLPRRQRVVLVLRYYEDLSESEIAEQLEWPVGTVKSTASRALEQLRRLLEESSAHDTAFPHQQIPLRKGASHDQAT